MSEQHSPVDLPIDSKAPSWTYEFLTKTKEDRDSILKWVKDTIETIKSPDEVVSHTITHFYRQTYAYVGTIIVKRFK